MVNNGDDQQMPVTITTMTTATIKYYNDDDKTGSCVSVFDVYICEECATGNKEKKDRVRRKWRWVAMDTGRYCRSCKRK
uniref:Uncharacterized protein n=1 Tax=Syphacia muris TaxID=451379 RepID=A0A0N5A7S7_9BILA